MSPWAQPISNRDRNQWSCCSNGCVATSSFTLSIAPVASAAGTPNPPAMKPTGRIAPWEGYLQELHDENRCPIRWPRRPRHGIPRGGNRCVE
jgi:hypothetical protein